MKMLYELWVTDGTAAGTTMLKDIYPGSGGSSPAEFAVFDNKLFFTANGETHGRELWVTDGTAAGTTLVTDLNPGSGDGLGFSDFSVFGSKLIFMGNKWRLWL